MWWAKMCLLLPIQCPWPVSWRLYWADSCERCNSSDHCGPGATLHCWPLPVFGFLSDCPGPLQSHLPSALTPAHPCLLSGCLAPGQCFMVPTASSVLIWMLRSSGAHQQSLWFAWLCCHLEIAAMWEIMPSCASELSGRQVEPFVPHKLQWELWNLNATYYLKELS